jgi:hypothetical protein
MAIFLTPASASTVDSITPVHSQQLSKPCVSCTVSPALPGFQP